MKKKCHPAKTWRRISLASATKFERRVILTEGTTNQPKRQPNNQKQMLFSPYNWQTAERTLHVFGDFI